MIRKAITIALCSLAMITMAGCSMDMDNGLKDNQPSGETALTLFLSGTVTDGLDRLPGIEVAVIDGTGKTVTNESGVFSIETKMTVRIGNPNEVVRLRATDTDGAENGLFKQCTVTVGIGEWEMKWDADKRKYVAEKSFNTITIKMERDEE